MGLTQSKLRKTLDTYVEEFGAEFVETFRRIMKESGFTYNHVSTDDLMYIFVL